MGTTGTTDSTCADYLREIEAGTPGTKMERADAWAAEDALFRRGEPRIRGVRLLLGRAMAEQDDAQNPKHGQKGAVKIQIGAKYNLGREMTDRYMTAAKALDSAPGIPIEILDYPLKEISRRAKLWMTGDSAWADEEAFKKPDGTVSYPRQ
jgi:hypothetical protein